jgi:hypothetical protein
MRVSQNRRRNDRHTFEAVVAVAKVRTAVQGRYVRPHQAVTGHK